MHDAQSTAVSTGVPDDVPPFGRDTRGVPDEHALAARGRTAPNTRLGHVRPARDAAARLNRIGVVALLAWAAFVYASYLLGLRG